MINNEVERILERFRKAPTSVSRGKGHLAKNWKTTTDVIVIAKSLFREEENALAKSQNISIDERLEELDLDIKDVKSIKFWQNMKGENRFSINTKPEWYKDKELADNILDELRAKLTEELTPYYTPFEYVEQQRALFILTADKHVGAKTSERSVYKNSYNADVFEDRMKKILDEVGQLHKLYGRFDRVYLVDLGDPLDGYNGSTTRGGHKLPQNMDNREQFDTYVTVHKKWFDTLMQMNVANNVHFVAVTEDNHAGAFGYCANRAVEIYLNVKYPAITTRIMSKFIEHVSYGEHTLLFTHGKDSEDMKHGLPRRLDQKTELYINDYIDHFKLGDKYVHLIKGDLHQESNEFGKRFRYKNVLSLYGASKWIHTNFGNSKSGACFEVIEKHTPRVHQHSIVF